MRPILNKSLKTLTVALFVLAIGGIAALAYQTRSDYYAKVSTSLAAKFAEQTLLVIQEHQRRAGSYPTSLDKLALPQGELGFIPRLTWDPASLRLLVHIASDHGRFGDLRFEAESGVTGALTWRCQNVSVEESFLPPSCRQ
jgi:hypothetical protein